MPRTRVKICGIKSVEMALAATEAGADAIGLIFVERSPRFVTPAAAKRIVAKLPAFVEPIGLFVDQSAEDVRSIADEVGLRTLQLHGHEGPGYIERLGDYRLIRSFAFERSYVREMIEPWRQVRNNLAALLWDAPPSPNKAPETALTGGSGTTFDWKGLAASRNEGVFADMPPLILAGGLTPDNVGEAIRMTGARQVDVASGVESAPGVKDPELMSRFLQSAAAPK